MKVEQYLKTVRKMSSRVIISLKHRPEGLQLNGEHIRTIDRIHAGDTLSVTMEDTPPDYLESEIRVPILYEDEDVMVYNKPVDMPCHQAKTHQQDTLANVFARDCRERGLTQQELADRIGVSNKSVSRWESGSYPDVPTLLSLARALDVTVDALLDPGAPVPTLQKSDWQNLLSFAFAIGGGLAFYLLRRFVPVPVCWALYLGCLAYGIYLQAHYTYHARWFRLGSWAMCFCVSWTLAEELGGVVFQVLFPTVLSQWKNMIFQLLRGDAGALLQLVLVLGPLWLAGACGLTVQE